MNIIEQVYSFIDKYHMLAPKELVMVGVSGGPDSMALLHILWMLRDDLRIFLHVAHLNHLLRGEEADADAQVVRDFATTLGLPCSVESIDVAAYRKEHGLSIQEAARNVRYHFFEREASRIGATKVALGHHADDQAETILFNLLRGTGPGGLKGIPPVRGIFVRPLLNVRRREIEDYCRHYALPVRRDPSNEKPVYTRNRIRLFLLPALERDYNPQIVPALIRLGDICREEDAYLEERAAEVYQTLLLEERGGKVVLSEEGLQSQPLVLCRRVLRMAWQKLCGTELSYYHVEALMELLSNPAGGRTLVLPRGVRAARKRNKLYMYKSTGPQMIPYYKYFLVIPGITYIKEIDKSIRAEILPVQQAPTFKEISSNEAVLDYDLLVQPLWVRPRQQGDVFSPFGLGKTVKLKKFFIDCKVPREERDRIPLVVSRDDIIWVGGLRSGEFWRVTKTTTRCLYLQLIEGNYNNLNYN